MFFFLKKRSWKSSALYLWNVPYHQKEKESEMLGILT